MSLLKAQVLPRLDGEHTATVKSYKEVANKNGGYIEVVFDLDNGAREYKENIFPKSVQYHARGIANQLGLDEPNVEEVLKAAKKESITLWLEYNNQYRNYDLSYYAPAAANTEEISLN